MVLVMVTLMDTAPCSVRSQLVEDNGRRMKRFGDADRQWRESLTVYVLSVRRRGQEKDEEVWRWQKPWREPATEYTTSQDVEDTRRMNRYGGVDRHGESVSLCTFSPSDDWRRMRGMTVMTVMEAASFCGRSHFYWSRMKGCGDGTVMEKASHCVRSR
jgi:hypothetical protein